MPMRSSSRKTCATTCAAVPGQIASLPASLADLQKYLEPAVACWCASISPGIRVRPPTSITRAPSGGASPPAAMAAMRPSSTSSAAPSRTGAVVPSNSRAFANHVRPGAAGGSLSRHGRRWGIPRTVSEEAVSEARAARFRRLYGSVDSPSAARETARTMSSGEESLLT